MTKHHPFALSTHLAQQLLDQANDGIVLSDPHLADNPLVYVNQAFLKMTGYTEDEVLGRNCRFLQGDTSTQESVQVVHDAIHKREPVLVTLKNYRKDGSEFYNELSVSPIFDNDGSILYFLGVQKDVTLEHERNASRDSFVSLVAHQLKSYPNAILWSSEELKDSKNLSETERDMVQTIRSTSTAMDETIKTLLNITRLQLGTFICNPEAMNVHDAFESSIETLRTPIDKKKLTINLDSVMEDATLFIDKNMLRIMIDILVSNAVKYTPDHGTIRIMAQKVNEMAFRLSVADSGIGIPKDEQEHLFTKMYRASNTQDRDGTGLGLYLLNIIMKTLEGTVSFESEEGKGTTFTIEIPTQAKAHEGTSQLS